jgi:hypothetical protein
LFDGVNDSIEPMTLGNMRENGVRSLAVHCHQRRHEVIINSDQWPGDLTVKWFERVHEMRDHRQAITGPAHAAGSDRVYATR